MQARTFKIIVGLAVLVPACSLVAAENVRAELARLQKESGLSLTWYLSGVTTARFADRSVTQDKEPPPAGRFEDALLSPDGEEIAFPVSGPEYGGPRTLTVVRRNGSSVRIYPELSDSVATCWSHDKSKLVVHAKTADARPPELFILDLASRTVRQFGDVESYTSNQCWSPDDSQIVYGTKDEVRVYDVKGAIARTIARGVSPTWSPDGKWIAFKQGDDYFAFSPSSSQTRELFKANKSRSGLWWSPDSRMVAYLNEGGTFWETLKVLDVGLIQIRVRRLADGAEDWVYQYPNVPPVWFMACQWLRIQPQASR
jgi:Tol biopolymer transport system component